MPKHRYYEKGDENIPYAITDGNGDVVLALCKVCNTGEASLTSDCCETPVSWQDEEAIIAGTLDYKNGHWLNPEKET